MNCQFRYFYFPKYFLEASSFSSFFSRVDTPFQSSQTPLLTHFLSVWRLLLHFDGLCSLSWKNGQEKVYCFSILISCCEKGLVLASGRSFLSSLLYSLGWYYQTTTESWKCGVVRISSVSTDTVFNLACFLMFLEGSLEETRGRKKSLGRPLGLILIFCREKRRLQMLAWSLG